MPHVDFIPKVFCISLKRASERRARMISRLNELNVDYQIVDAVDGRELDMSTLDGRLRQDFWRRQKGKDLAPNEVGCYLSHYNIWRQIVDEKMESAIIVEDDADFSADFLTVASAAARIPYDWDVITLHHIPKRKVGQTLCNLNHGEHRVMRGRQRIVQAIGYMISESGARRLLDYCYEIRAAIDVAYSEYWLSGILYYSVYPGIIHPDGGESTIWGHGIDTSIVDQELGLNTVPFSERMRGKAWRWRQRLAIDIYNWRTPLPSHPKETHDKR